MLPLRLLIHSDIEFGTMRASKRVSLAMSGSQYTQSHAGAFVGVQKLIPGMMFATILKVKSVYATIPALVSMHIDVNASMKTKTGLFDE